MFIFDREGARLAPSSTGSPPGKKSVLKVLECCPTSQTEIGSG